MDYIKCSISSIGAHSVQLGERPRNGWVARTSPGSEWLAGRLVIGGGPINTQESRAAE